MRLAPHVRFLGGPPQQCGGPHPTSGRPRRPGSGSPRWTTGSPPSTTQPTWRGYSRSATAWARNTSTRCCASGCGSCPTRSRPSTRPPATAMSLSILQAEFSLTQMLDRPVSGRIFFEQVLHDNLDIGRPDQVSLIFDRKLRRRGPLSSTPGRFRTRVITDGVVPSLHIDYKNTKIKQYHKEGRALRTGRVAPVHCCTGAPSGPRMHVSRARGPSKPLGRFRSSAAARCFPPAGAGCSAPVAGGVYEVCSVAARGAGRVVVDQVVRLDRLPGDPQEPVFPALGGLGGWSGVSRFSPHRLHRPSCLDSRRTV